MNHRHENDLYWGHLSFLEKWNSGSAYYAGGSVLGGRRNAEVGTRPEQGISEEEGGLKDNKKPLVIVMGCRSTPLHGQPPTNHKFSNGQPATSSDRSDFSAE